jgi:hypothetical protein
MKKSELLDELESSRERLLELIDDLQAESYEEPGVNGAWSLKDVLSHLARWEAELVKLLWQISQGQAPTSAHFSGIGTDMLNEKWLGEMRSRPLPTVLEDYHNVRNQTMRRIEDFSDKELAEAKRYRWLGERPLWEWVAEGSFEHENEHALQIKAWRDKKGAG